MLGALPIKTSETLLGFASRYACFRGVSLTELMRHTSMRIWHYASFDAAVQRLSSMSGNDAAMLKSQALRMQEGGTFHKLNGQVFSRRDVSREAARYCPHCVIADYAVGGFRPFSNIYCRASWVNRELTICPDHEIEIISISKPYEGYAREDFSSALIDNWKEVVTAAETALHSPASGYDRYFCDRLNGLPVSNEVLDELPYYGALRLCEVLGAMEIGGDHITRSKLSFEERQRMAKTGYDLLAPGYPALRAFLEQRDHRRLESDGKGVGRQLYGILYTYLHDHAELPEFERIIEFVRDHAFNAHALGPENKFLGRGGERKFHSIRSASMEYGIHPATLRKMLHAEGLLDKETDLRDLKVSIQVDVMNDLAARWIDGVPMVYVRERLDTSPPVIGQLLEAGFLTASDREIDHKLKKYFSSKQIEDFFERLERMATTDVEEMVTLKRCAPFMTYGEIIRAVFNGDLALGISKTPGEKTNLSHLLVAVEDVRAMAGVRRVPTGYYRSTDVCARMATTNAVIDHLTQAGIFETIEYKGTFGTVTAYSENSVKAFVAKHISFRKLARGKANWEKTERRVANVKPAYDLGGIERIYRKADLGM